MAFKTYRTVSYFIVLASCKETGTTLDEPFCHSPTRFVSDSRPPVFLLIVVCLGLLIIKVTACSSCYGCLLYVAIKSMIARLICRQLLFAHITGEGRRRHAQHSSFEVWVVWLQ